MTATGARMLMVLAAAVWLCAGCGPRKLTVEPGPTLEQHHPASVVVVPFQRLKTPQVLDPEGPALNVPRGAKRSDISLDVGPRAAEQTGQRTVAVPEFVPDKVADEVYTKLRQRVSLRVLSPGEALPLLKQLGGDASDWPLEKLGREIAAKLNVDAALVGKVLIYRERSGSRAGADPAAVGFEVHLIAADGARLWSANYYEKQRPANEDIFGFFERGPGFVTADELITYGAEQIAKKFPYGEPR